MTLLQLCNFCSNTVWQKKSKKNFEITCFASIFFVPLHCHLKGRPLERTEGRRAAYRHAQRKGSAPYAERLGRRNRAARQKVRTHSVSETKVSETNLMFNL